MPSPLTHRAVLREGSLQAKLKVHLAAALTKPRSEVIRPFRLVCLNGTQELQTGNETIRSCE